MLLFFLSYSLFSELLVYPVESLERLVHSISIVKVSNLCFPGLVKLELVRDIVSGLTASTRDVVRIRIERH